MTPTVKVLVEPASPAYSLADLRRELNLGTSTDWDDSLTAHAAEAVAHLIAATGRALLPTTFTQAWDTLPEELVAGVPITLRRAPVTSIDEITYIDSTGTAQTWPSSNYLTDLAAEPAKIALAPSATLPDVATDRLAAFTVWFQAGYTSVPAEASEYIRSYVQLRYERRAPTELERDRFNALLAGLTYEL